jgi:glycosyltransferase involved in cell wall biosynthesis
MWELIIEKGNEIRNISKIFANIFCMQFDSTGNKIGYAESYLKNAIQYLDGLISDNKRFNNDAINVYKLNNDSNKFHTIYTPTRVISEKEFAIVENHLDNYEHRINKTKKLRCIWAGRLDYQKRWDLFISIVQKCSFCEFDMYGKSVVDKNPILPDLPNLNFYGSYLSSSDVYLKKEYDVFIFTSQWEGLPTILLEAGIYGIPIIAPSVGGVGELVNNETGYILSEKPTIDDYVDALLSIKNNPQEAARRAKNMINLIHERHNWSGFILNVNKLAGYLEC